MHNFNGNDLFIEERKQKSFITDAFGQYLSPDVIEALVDDPDKLSLGPVEGHTAHNRTVSVQQREPVHQSANQRNWCGGCDRHQRCGNGLVYEGPHSEHLLFLRTVTTVHLTSPQLDRQVLQGALPIGDRRLSRTR